jgi:hypothetical protein
MIKANELRIGNLVLIDGEESEIHGGLIADFETDCFDGKIEPIPLNEEWLIKFGFERRVFAQRNEYILIIDIDNQKHFIEFAFPRNEKIQVIMYYDKCFYKHIKYVHQLQNLYFALTGQELEIKTT